MNDELKLLCDQRDIERLAILVGRATDAWNEDDGKLWQQCMTDDIEIIYPFGSWRGIEAHKKIHRDTIKKVFTFVQHYITNPLIDVDGDKARAQYYAQAAHGVPTRDGVKVIMGACIYTHDLVRTAQGWRISRLQCRTTWIDDEGGLMAAVGDAYNASPA